ncbi:hypothetical protein [Spongiimicrobium salis]|uniref:hypothetical protein n=1 Tax=Spongiimicrobium salis TaxID=1667022 RepID=UPI00374D7CA8
MKLKKTIQTVFLFLMIGSISSCVSTRIEASPYPDSVVNLECQRKSSWSYFWGLQQKTVSANPEIENTECPCREKAMAYTVVKTSFGDSLLSLVTLGTVNRRTAIYGCARPVIPDEPSLDEK